MPISTIFPLQTTWFFSFDDEGDFDFFETLHFVELATMATNKQSKRFQHDTPSRIHTASSSSEQLQRELKQTNKAKQELLKQEEAIRNTMKEQQEHIERILESQRKYEELRIALKRITSENKQLMLTISKTKGLLQKANDYVFIDEFRRIKSMHIHHGHDDEDGDSKLIELRSEIDGLISQNKGLREQLQQTAEDDDDEDMKLELDDEVEIDNLSKQSLQRKYKMLRANNLMLQKKMMHLVSPSEDTSDFPLIEDVRSEFETLRKQYFADVR